MSDLNDLTPLSNEEIIMKAIINGQPSPVIPISRREVFLAAIAARIAAGGGTGSGGGVASVGGIYPDLSGNVALKKLTFTGAVEGSYDGSKAMTINIPEAMTDSHINNLIDEKLGVIENGTY